MNKEQKMSYKGYIFSINPSIIRIKHRAELAKNSVPFHQEQVQQLGRKACIISGEGVLVGYECEKQFADLRRLFMSEGSGLLILPGIDPFYAFFEGLELLDEPSEELIKYSFSFCEDTNAKHFKARNDVRAIAEDGDTLWDISYHNDIPIEELLDKNPNIMRPDMRLDVGEVILL